MTKSIAHGGVRYRCLRGKRACSFLGGSEQHAAERAHELPDQCFVCASQTGAPGELRVLARGHPFERSELVRLAVSFGTVDMLHERKHALALRARIPEQSLDELRFSTPSQSSLQETIGIARAALSFVVVDRMQLRKLALVQYPADEQAGRLPPEEHDMAGMLETPKSGPDAVAAPRERMAFHEPLKNLVEVGNVALGTLVAPSFRAE